MASPQIITARDRAKLTALADLMDKGVLELRENFAVRLSDGGTVWPASARRIETAVKRLTDASAYLRELARA